MSLPLESDISSASGKTKPRLYSEVLDPSESQLKTWENDFLIFKNGKVIQCLVCYRQFKQYSEHIIKQHYNIFHSCDFKKYEGEERQNEIQWLKNNLLGSLATEPLTNRDKAALMATYKICLQMAEEGRACGDGNFVKSNIISTSLLCCCDDCTNNLSKLDLSPTTVARRIFELASKVQKQLLYRTKKIIAYSLALDVRQFENRTYLALFVRGVQSNLRVSEYFLQMIPIDCTTTSNDIFYALSEVINDSGLQWKNLFTMSISPKIVQDRSDLVTLIKKGARKQGNKNDIIDLAYMPNSEILCPKSTKLQDVMLDVIQTLCTMRADGSNRREFSSFLTDLERNYDNIPRCLFNYCKEDWLKISEVLKGFLSLMHEVKEFLTMKKMKHNLDNTVWVLDCAFLCDLIEHLHNLNISLRNTSQSIAHFLEKLASFQLKISLWIEQLKCKNFCHFTAIESIIQKKSLQKETINNIDFFIEILKQLHDDLNAYINIDKSLKKKLEIFVTPFKVEPITTDVLYQFELIDLQCDRTMLAKYENRTNNLSEFYKNLPKEIYPQIYNLAIQVLCMFGSTSVFEQFSSCLKRCEKGSPIISNMHLNSMLRIITTPTIAPNIDTIVSEKIQTVESRLLD